MKLIYSQLQKFLPGLDVVPQKLRDDMTMIGHFCNFYEEIDNEIVFDLDIKVNRGDCLGYYGMAKDLSILYSIPIKLPESFTYPNSNYSLPIKVTSSDVTRVMSLKIVHAKNTQSPNWLKTFLKLHNVNSVNTIVDLTNYIMFMYGLPNHAFDSSKTTDKLIWENNNGKTSKFTTLDGTVLDLYPENLVISNPSQVLSTDLVGGKNSGIDISTTDLIIEVAIYNKTRIRLDSKILKTVTEASTRLEKDLDPQLIPIAINHLALLIIDNCGGSIGSQVFDYYPNPVVPPVIDFDPTKPSLYSGINIPIEFANDIVSKVGYRPDINLEEDLIEEVIRFFGYNNIPTNQPLPAKNLPDITPKQLYLIDLLKDKLIELGYDEVLSWPLTTSPLDQDTAVFTQNSINSEYPVLRQSIIQSLKIQLDSYNRYKLPKPQFFEIGKVFSFQNGKYVEHNSLGIYHHNPTQLTADIEKIQVPLVKEGFREIGNFAEINLDDLDNPPSYSPKVINNTAIELTSQIISLDANITLNTTKSLSELLEDFSSKIDKNILWSLEIIDVYKNKYTFRVNYYNCNDKTAKKIHLSTFGLDKLTNN